MDKYYGEWDIKIIGFYGSYNAPYLYFEIHKSE